MVTGVVVGGFGPIPDPGGRGTWWDATQGCLSVDYKWTTVAWDQATFNPLLTMASDLYESGIGLELDANITDWQNPHPTTGTFDLHYQVYEQGTNQLREVNTSPFTRAATENQWQTIEVRWKNGTTDNNLTSVASDGWLHVYVNGMPIYELNDIALILNSDTSAGRPNLLRTVWLGFYGLFGPSTNLTLTNQARAGGPGILLTSPPSGSTFVRLADIILSAQVDNSAGDVAGVDFYVDGVLTGSPSGPNSTVWSSAMLGAHTVTAKVVRMDGSTGWAPNPATTTLVDGSHQNDALYVSQMQPPGLLAPGETAVVSVSMQNTGTTAWTHTSDNDLHNFRLGSWNPQDGSTWGLTRIDLPIGAVINPGQTYTFPFTIVAPTTPGTYTFEWRMVEEGVEWFGGNSATINVQVSGTPIISGHCPGASPFDDLDDDVALNQCLSRGGLVTLSPGSPGYLISSGLNISVNGTQLTTAVPGVKPILRADPNLRNGIINVTSNIYFHISYVHLDGMLGPTRNFSCQDGTGRT